MLARVRRRRGVERRFTIGRRFRHWDATPRGRDGTNQSQPHSVILARRGDMGHAGLNRQPHGGMQPAGARRDKLPDFS